MGLVRRPMQLVLPEPVCVCMCVLVAHHPGDDCDDCDDDDCSCHVFPFALVVSCMLVLYQVIDTMSSPIRKYSYLPQPCHLKLSHAHSPTIAIVVVMLIASSVSIVYPLPLCDCCSCHTRLTIENEWADCNSHVSSYYPVGRHLVFVFVSVSTHVSEHTEPTLPNTLADDALHCGQHTLWSRCEVVVSVSLVACHCCFLVSHVSHYTIVIVNCQ